MTTGIPGLSHVDHVGLTVPDLDAAVVPEALTPRGIPDGEPRTPIDHPWETEVAEIAQREIPKRKTRKAGWDVFLGARKLESSRYAL